MVVLIGIGLTTTLVLYALRANIDLFYTPGEILQGKGERHEKPEIGQRLRIGGMVMPGSVNRWPPSGTICKSTSGQAFFSAQAAAGGVQQSCRPCTITPGIPRNRSASRRSWPSSSSAASSSWC